MSDDIREQLKRALFAKIAKARIPSLEKDGREYTGLCPFHNEKTPSFKIYQQDDGVWLYKCFGCGATGNVFQFVEKIDKIDHQAAVEKVKSEFEWEKNKGVVDSVFKGLDSGMPEKKFVTFPLERMKVAEQALEQSHAALTWLANRGIGVEIARKMHLGFVQSLKAITQNHPWVDEGWIAFPTVDGDTITAIKYRSLKGKKTEDGKKAGILRAPNTTTTLYNLNSVTSFDDAFIVEGEPDTVVVNQAGYIAVGLPSAEYSPTATERDVLTRAQRIFLAGDMDGVGQAAMKKLWSEFKDRTYLIEWPAGIKDANDAFLKLCKGDVRKFQGLIEGLKVDAIERPMLYIHDLKYSMRSMDRTNPMDDPSRLRFPWASIDSWTPIVPGDVMCLFATESKTGKTSWLMNVLLHNAIHHNKVIVNYSAELTSAAYARRAIAHLVGRDRDHLEQADFDKAIKIMKQARFYNGYQPRANYKTVIDLFTAAKQRLGADIFVVDHLHFLTRGTKDENQAVSDAMRMLKDFAVEYGVIVIIVGQPRKRPSGQKKWEATSQDAKSSEAFGSDASQVFILHRERINNPTEAQPIFSPVTKIKLDYSRESADKFTNLYFEGASCTFLETTPSPEPTGEEA